MAPALIAVELFGHERGAFTGAFGERAGAFERAHGGTVLLDEIGELPIDLQPMLLGVLERRRFKRIGGVRERQVDVRVSSAAHRDLRGATNLGTFRADLYFRRRSRACRPPCARPETSQRSCALRGALRGSTPAFARRTLARSAHTWRGNVRGYHGSESAVALVRWSSRRRGLARRSARPSRVDTEDALSRFRTASARARRAAFERTTCRAFQTCGGNASEAARRAKMDRPYLLSLLRKHGLR